MEAGRPDGGGRCSGGSCRDSGRRSDRAQAICRGRDRVYGQCLCRQYGEFHTNKRRRREDLRDVDGRHGDGNEGPDVGTGTSRRRGLHLGERQYSIHNNGEPIYPGDFSGRGCGGESAGLVSGDGSGFGGGR